MNADNTFTDARDGKKYKTVKIGNQTWMAENLAYKASSGCWAYDNNQENVKTYGYLYDWKTAKKVCPAVITVIVSKDLPKVEGFYSFPFGGKEYVMPKLHGVVHFSHMAH